MRLTLLLGVLALAIGAMAQMAMHPPQRTIAVTGTAERMVMPDLAYAVVAVETQADTVAQAVELNTTATNRVLAAIRGLNVPGLTLRTLAFDVQPIYETQPPNRPTTQPARIVGYRVVNRVEVRIPQADAAQLSTAVSRVVTVALDAGANRVDQVRFDLQNRQQAQREVLAAAVQDAQATAQALAQAAGVTLGPLQTLSVTPVYLPVLARGGELAEARVPIEPGLMTITTMVQAVYLIQ